MFPLTDNDTPVHAAVRANHQSVVRELLQMEADINSGNNNGDTALTLAVASGNEELLQDLLAAGSNPAKRPRLLLFLNNNYALKNFILSRVIFRDTFVTGS